MRPMVWLVLGCSLTIGAIAVSYLQYPSHSQTPPVSVPKTQAQLDKEFVDRQVAEATANGTMGCADEHPVSPDGSRSFFIRNIRCIAYPSVQVWHSAWEQTFRVSVTDEHDNELAAIPQFSTDGFPFEPLSLGRYKCDEATKVCSFFGNVWWKRGNAPALKLKMTPEPSLARPIEMENVTFAPPKPPDPTTYTVPTVPGGFSTGEKCFDTTTHCELSVPADKWQGYLNVPVFSNYNAKHFTSATFHVDLVNDAGQPLAAFPIFFVWGDPALTQGYARCDEAARVCRFYGTVLAWIKPNTKLILNRIPDATPADRCCGTGE